MWDQFGLLKNPYDISPLLEGGGIPEAFVGREKEQQYIDLLLQSDDRLALTICGNVGVGKTSLVNYEKFVWKHRHKNKLLFSFRRELEVNEAMLDKKTFLVDVIGSILKEIELIDRNLLQKNDFLTKLNQLVNITQTLGLSGSINAGLPGFGLQSNFSEKQNTQPFLLTAAALERHFIDLLTFIRTKKIAGKQYHGLIIHVNNFELVMQSNKKGVQRFFGEIRDLLQTPHLYSIFLGPSHFYKDIIAPDLRVRSIFVQTPIILSPLSKAELVRAINKRLQLIKAPTAKTIIKPFEDEVINELYELFSGDIRMVMSSLQDIVRFRFDKLPRTLGKDEALLSLGKERLSYIENILTDEQMKILAYIVSANNPVTQNQIAQALEKAPTNVSSYYFKPLLDHNIIEIRKETGKLKYWGLTKKYLPLTKVMQSHENIQKQLDQLRLI